MSETKDTKPESAQPISQEQAAQVGGGDGTCTSTVTVGGVSSPTESFGTAVTQTYEGAVEGTSYIIERVVKSMS